MSLKPENNHKVWGLSQSVRSLNVSQSLSLNGGGAGGLKHFTKTGSIPRKQKLLRPRSDPHIEWNNGTRAVHCCLTHLSHKQAVARQIERTRTGPNPLAAFHFWISCTWRRRSSPAAPPNDDTCWDYFILIAETHPAYGRKDRLWNHQDPRRLSAVQPDRLDRPREEQSHNKNQCWPGLV